MTCRKLLKRQQEVIDSIGVPDDISSHEVLDKLHGLQFVGAVGVAND